MLLLSVIQGPDKGRHFELPDHEPQLVGRSSEALPLTDNTVSRRHAEMTPDAGEWFIRDLGSQNGTWINGVKIDGRVQLKPGDQVRAGATLMTFGRTEPDPAHALVKVVRQDELDATVERTMASNEDSVILAEPEPRQAAADHLRVIYRLTTLTGAAKDRAALLEGVMDLVFSEFRPERGVIVVSEDAQATPKPAVVRYSAKAAGRSEREILLSRSILQLALRRGEGVLSSNAMADARFKAGDSIQQMHIRSAICSPIRFRERTFGAIYIDSSIANYTFTTEQLALMNAIGQHTALALANTELQQQKLQSERLAVMGETVASLSHSIKNILQGLRGGADVVEMGLKKNDLKVSTGGWSILKRNLDRIIGLTMNMLAYSRPRTLEIELTKVGALLDDCASLLADRCESKGVALIIDADPEMPPIPIDSGQIHQALMNLLTNALEAVEAKSGAITVKATFTRKPATAGGLASAEAGDATIEVFDNGPGIPPEVVEKIYEPFFTTKGMRGTGLGLAVTKRIVEQHGGQIEVRSQLGKGTAFTVVLPVDPGQTIDPSATTASRSGPVPMPRL